MSAGIDAPHDVTRARSRGAARPGAGRPWLASRAGAALGSLGLALVLGPPARVVAAPPPFRPPRPVVRTLDNGLTVAVFRDVRLPIAQVQLTVNAGSAAEGSLPEGVAYIVSQLIGQATSSRDPQALQDDLDRAGGRLNTRIGRDVTILSATFLSAELASGLDLVGDAVRNALLTEGDFTRVRRTARALAAGPAGLARQGENELWRAAFGSGPYGRAPAGTPESLDRLTLSDVRAFTIAHWTPTGALLAVAGDVEPDSVFALARDVFGEWVSRAPASGAPAAATAPKRAVRIVDRPGDALADVWVGLPGPRAGDADEIPIALAGQLAARSLVGLNDVRTGQSALRDGGLVWLAASARPESAAFVARRLETALTSLRTTPASGEPLAALERAVQSAFPMRFESLEGLTDQWSAEAALGLSFDNLIAFPDHVGAVTSARLATAARRWFDPQSAQFVAVGPGKAMRAALAAVGPVIAGGGATARVTPALEKRGRDLIARAVAAHGGLAALRKVHDSVLEGDAMLQLGPRDINAHVTQTRKEPNRMIYDLKFLEAGSREVLSGDHAWSAPLDSLASTHDADSATVASLRQGFRADVVHLLLDAADPAAKVAARGSEQANGGTVENVEVWAPGGLHRSLYFDPGTGLLVGADLHEAGDRDGGSATRRWYRDVRPVDGLRLPFTEERWRGGQRVMLLTITRYALNTGVADAQFARPESPLPPSSR